MWQWSYRRDENVTEVMHRGGFKCFKIRTEGSSLTSIFIYLNRLFLTKINPFPHEGRNFEATCMEIVTFFGQRACYFLGIFTLYA